MEIVEPTEQHEHKWLEWLGLEEPPPNADTWEPVARAFHVDYPETNTSRGAAALIAVLKQAGIDAQQRSYEWDEAVPGAVWSVDREETHVAVGVHERDRERATEIARKFMSEHDSHEEAELAVSDAELTKDALEAGPPPEGLGQDARALTASGLELRVLLDARGGAGALRGRV